MVSGDGQTFDVHSHGGAGRVEREGGNWLPAAADISDSTAAGRKAVKGDGSDLMFTFSESLEFSGMQLVGLVQAALDAMSALSEYKADVSTVKARPAMWVWDGEGTWEAPDAALPDVDTVLNLATGEIHTVEEV